MHPSTLRLCFSERTEILPQKMEVLASSSTNLSTELTKHPRLEYIMRVCFLDKMYEANFLTWSGYFQAQPDSFAPDLQTISHLGSWPLLLKCSPSMCTLMAVVICLLAWEACPGSIVFVKMLFFGQCVSWLTQLPHRTAVGQLGGQKQKSSWSWWQSQEREARGHVHFPPFLLCSYSFLFFWLLCVYDRMR